MSAHQPPLRWISTFAAQFHRTPKHASWLNMVEIGVLPSQCLDRRIDSGDLLVGEVARV
ncbi:MAG TPA: hypothetical protein VI199_06305 [Novosphingobium sp.]